MLAKLTKTDFAWRADDINDLKTYHVQLDDTILSLLKGNTIERKRGLNELATLIVSALESKIGFTIIDRLPIESFSLEELNDMLKLLGHMMGTPVPQGREKHSSLFDLQDEGQKIAEGARFSKTSDALDLHTDNARSKNLPSYVGYLCVSKAQKGGASMLANAYTIHNELFRRDPSILKVLFEEPYYFDRRGLSGEEEEPYAKYPVFKWRNNQLECRFMPYYMNQGHIKAGVPMTAKQKKAFEQLRTMFNCQDYRIDFLLEPGQILFFNNHWIVHGRTSFNDDEHIPNKRHLIRLWIEKAIS